MDGTLKKKIGYSMAFFFFLSELDKKNSNNHRIHVLTVARS